MCSETCRCLVKSFVSCRCETIGWDRATRHRGNACEREHRQHAEAERQLIQTKLKQGEEMGLKPGNKMHGDLTGRPSGLAVLSILFVYFAGAADNVPNKE